MPPPAPRAPPHAAKQSDTHNVFGPPLLEIAGAYPPLRMTPALRDSRMTLPHAVSLVGFGRPMDSALTRTCSAQENAMRDRVRADVRHSELAPIL